MMRIIHGVPLAAGLGVGPALVWKSTPPCSPASPDDDWTAQFARFLRARDHARERLEKLRQSLRYGERDTDETALGETLAQVIEELAETFDLLADDYARQRTLAMADDTAAIVASGGTAMPAGASPSACGGHTPGRRWVLAAGKWSWRELARVDWTQTAAILVKDGENTESVAALAMEHGVPAVALPATFWESVKTGDIIMVDGSDGRVIARPDEDTLVSWRSRHENGRVTSGSNRLGEAHSSRK